MKIPSTLQRLLAPMLLVYVFNSLPLEDSVKLTIARFLFGAKSVGIIAVLIVIRLAIERSRLQSDEKVRVENTSWETGEMELVTETISAYEYDHRELQKAVTQHGVQTIVVMGLHYQWEVVVPLVIGCLAAFTQVWESPLFRIYCRGRSKFDDADLKRPFKISMDTTGFYKRFMGLGAKDNNKKPSARSLKKEAKAKEKAERRKVQ